LFLIRTTTFYRKETFLFQPAFNVYQFCPFYPKGPRAILTDCKMVGSETHVKSMNHAFKTKRNGYSHSHFYSHFGFLKCQNPYFTLVLLATSEMERVKGIEPSFRAVLFIRGEGRFSTNA